MSAAQKSRNSVTSELELPAIGYLTEYIRAFYHGLAVDQLRRRMRFVPWDENYGLGERRQNSIPGFIDLAAEDDCVRIRVRLPSGTSKAQLNLNEILDAPS